MYRKINLSSIRNAAIQTGPQAKHFPVMKSTMLPPGTYDGKVAFVTGGGTGLGKGMATKFAELGASVVISSRKLENLEKAAEEIVQQVPNGTLKIIKSSQFLNIYVVM